MKKTIFLFFAAILCAMTANAYDQSAVDLYFDNSEAKWSSCYVYIGHGTWTSCYPLTRVSGTQYLWKLAKANFNGGQKWDGASGWVLCNEKWWDNQGETIDKFVHHGDKNVTQKSTIAWSVSYIYKTNGTANTTGADNKTIKAYKMTTVSNKNYTVTINTVEGGTLTVKDYDDNAVATGASKIYLTVLKFSAAPASGYVLDAVEINDGTNTTTIAAADLATKTHTLTSNVTITPVWRATTSTVTVTATATNGTVTGGGVVEEGTSVTLTATPADGYKFVNWTVGGAEVSTANPYTFTAEEDVTVVANFEELPKTTVYLVNNSDWTKVYAYGWDGTKGETPAWPGAEITANKLAEKYKGYDVYSYKVEEGSYGKVIFNNGSGKQTATFDWTDGNYYYAVDPLGSNVFLAGDMNEWNGSADELKKETAEGTTASIKVNLTAKTYEFKLVIDGVWKANTGTMQRGGQSVHEGGWSFDKDGYDDKCKLVADIAGDYIFTWDLTTKKLTVTYPALPKHQVTATVNPAETGEVTGTGEYEQGSTATLVAVPAANYAFKNWTEGGEEVSTEATYSFKVTKAVELVANFVPEVTHEVTVSYLCGGTPIPGHDAHTLAVGVTTPSTITAPAITDYTFSGWELGSGVTSTDDPSASSINIKTLSTGDYTLTANYTAIPTETVYLVNNSDWTKVYAYGWDGTKGETPAWPGAEITTNKLAEKYEGYDVYSYKVEEGSYGKVIFNNGSGKQTATFDWENGKYYYAVDPLGSNVFLAGDMNEWNGSADELKKETAEGTTASIKVNLTAKTYEFKLVIDGAWKANTGTMQRGGQSVHEGGWSFDKDGYDDKCKLVADIAGDYIFTWDLTTKKLTVTYPALPKHQVTATVNPAETGEVTGTGEYEQGSKATLIATPAAGYAFKNWTVGGTEKSTEATYTFTVNEPISLVANFIPEVTHEVTVSYICNSNPIPGHDAHTLAVGVTTPSTITAPAITNYTFNGWTLGSGVQAVDANANPIQITTKAEGEYTLTANYTKIELTYTVKVPEGTEKCYIAGEMNSWSFQEMTPTANANEFTITIDGATTAHKYKYTCGEGWAYVEKKADGSDLDADRTYNANDVVAKWAEPAKCYLMGIGGDWTTGIEMEEDGDQFKLLCQPIAEGEQFKFKYGDTWTTDVENYEANGVAWVESYPGSGQYNITLPAGNYDFYYKKNENKVWIGVCTPATPTPDYTRTTTADKFGTICLPFGSTNYTGMELFECVGQETGKVYIASVTTLEAGVPYIFLATGTELAVYSDGTTAATPGNHNGLHGTFDDETPVAAGNYILLNNELRPSDGNAKVNANRAYLDMSGVPVGAPQQMPGRRYIGMSVQGENETTGVEDLFTTDTPVKVIENGQLIIIRDGVKYNVQGQKL